MDIQFSQNNTLCLPEDILLYLDGEMLPADELVFEGHIANCKDCHSELNIQKQMHSALDFAFDEGFSDIDPPEDFAKTITVKAESGVRGLRQPRERSLALFFSLLMALLVVIGLGAGTSNFFAMIFSFTEQVYSVMGFAAHIAYDISLGLAVVLRSVSHQFVFNNYSFGILIVMFLFLTTLTGYVMRLHRR